MNNIIIRSFLSVLIVLLSNSSALYLEGKWHSTKSSHYFYFRPDHRFEGNDGCNWISGSWRISNDSLILSDEGSTLMACTRPDVIIEWPDSGPYIQSRDTLRIYNKTSSFTYYKEAGESVSVPVKSPEFRTRNQAATTFYDITGRRIASLPLTGTINQQSGIFILREKNICSIKTQFSDK